MKEDGFHMKVGEFCLSVKIYLQLHFFLKFLHCVNSSLFKEKWIFVPFLLYWRCNQSSLFSSPRSSKNSLSFPLYLAPIWFHWNWPPGSKVLRRDTDVCTCMWTWQSINIISSGNQLWTNISFRMRHSFSLVFKHDEHCTFTDPAGRECQVK